MLASSLKQEQPKLLTVETTDGWRLAVTHWPGVGPRRHRHPVLMLHGIATNRLNLDLNKRYSLAQAVSKRGFDVYILEVRGAGLSQPQKTDSKESAYWGFRDFADHDVPAAVHRILEHSGAPQLHGVGHSLGGMLLYSLGVRQHISLRSITTLGTSCLRVRGLAQSENHFLRLATKLAPGKGMRLIPIRRIMGAAGRFITLSRRLADGLILSASNTEDAVMERLASEGINDIPLQLVFEITEQVMAPDPNGPFAHEFKYDHINVPVFAIAGCIDRIAPPHSVRAAIASIDCDDLRYREMGTKFGDAADYGHVDLLVGRHAPEEVYPLVGDFLQDTD